MGSLDLDGGRRGWLTVDRGGEAGRPVRGPERMRLWTEGQVAGKEGILGWDTASGKQIWKCGPEGGLPELKVKCWQRWVVECKDGSSGGKTGTGTLRDSLEPTRQTVEQAWASGLQRLPLPSPSLFSSSFSVMSNVTVNWIGSDLESTKRQPSGYTCEGLSVLH